VGVAIDSIDDMRRLFDGIPLGEVSTSMTINATAPLLLLLYQLVAEEQGVPRPDPGHGPERHPQGVRRPGHLHLPAGAVDAARHRPVRVRAKRAPGVEHHLDQRVSHPGGGLHRRPGAGFTIANGSPTCEAAVAAGLDVDGSPPALLLLERAQPLLRGGGQVPGRPPDLGRRTCARDGAPPTPKSWAMRFHTQTAGSPSPPSSPSTTWCGPPSRRWPRSWAAPSRCTPTPSTRRSASPPRSRPRSRCAPSRSSPHESGVTDTVDPLAGSYFVESLTDALEEPRPPSCSTVIEEMGGAVAAIEAGWMQAQIEDAAYEEARARSRGESVVVGVNRFDSSRRGAVPVMRSTPRWRPNQRGPAAAAGGPRRRSGDGLAVQSG
jgi:methylmalonyl-CoA mutase, N-terminal domain